MKPLSKYKNLGSAPSVVDGPAVIDIPPQPEKIEELWLFVKKITTQSLTNLNDNNPIIEFAKIVVKTDTSEWTLSGPFISEINASLGPYLSQLEAIADDEFHYVPPRVIKMHTPIWPGNRIRVEIYTNSGTILGGTTANGEFLYIVKSRSESIVPAVQTLFTATTTQREFAVAELSELGEKQIPIRNDSRLVKYIAIHAEKNTATWGPIDENTDDIGDFIIQCGTDTLYNDNFKTLRAISHSQLKKPEKLPAGLFILRLLPRDFPHALLYNAALGPNTVDTKLSIRGRSSNTVPLRITVSVIAYDQLVPTKK